MNNLRNFDDLQVKRLGKYIYALRDPRDKKIFYVGQGSGNRVFDHFNQADGVNRETVNLQNVSSKTLRILDIWKNEEDVEWIILAYNLPTDNYTADYVEAAIYDALLESQNGETLNEDTPPRSTKLSSDEVVALAAEFVNPNVAISNVFIFPIQNAVNRGADIYDATRMVWYVNNPNRNLENSVAVGLKYAISVGSYQIKNWNTAVLDANKHEFTAVHHTIPNTNDSLLNKNWINVLDKAKGFWQRGNYLIVAFDGQGHFRIKRGSQDKTTWHDCV
jgi:hypothetical protein